MHIAITGASGGLGAALALEFAASGVTLSLAGRNRAALDDIANRCQMRGAFVKTTDFDLRDHDALRTWLTASDQALALDLFFANAGVSLTASPDGVETQDDLDRLLAVNATATLVSINHAARLMAARGNGHIGTVCSLAALLPLPDSPGYCAGKAAARMYSLALRQKLKKKGVKITVICPGYLDTPMGRRVSTATPFLWTPERAAGHIARKIRGNPAEIVFPWPLALGIRLLDFLPRKVAAFFANHFAYRISPDSESTAIASGGLSR